MRLVDITEVLVNTLRASIPNPHPSGNFIYTDFPRLDATFPRISVTQVGGSVTEIGIGESIGGTQKGQLCTVDYDIDIWVKVDDRVIIDSQVYVGTKLRDKYADLIISTLETQKNALKVSHGILDIESLGISSVPLDEENMLHRKTITVRITYEWVT